MTDPIGARLARPRARAALPPRRADRATLDLAEVREYFRLFDQEALLDEPLGKLG
jgi:hypothetical protein